MTLETITAEKRLLALAGSLSRQGNAVFDSCRLMGVDPVQRFTSSGRSAFNNKGSPLQLSLSAGKKGLSVRLLADPQTSSSPWEEKRQRGWMLLEQLMDKEADTTLVQACRSIAEICLPAGVSPLSSEDTKSGIGFGLALGSPGLSVYGYGPWSSSNEAWDFLTTALAGTIPMPQPICAHIEKIRPLATLHGIGLSGSHGCNARIKLYWKLTNPTRIDKLGLPLESYQPFIDFLHLLSTERGFSSETLFFCSGFDWQKGTFRDFKIDACNCPDCLAMSQARLISIMEMLSHHHEIPTTDLRATIYKQEVRCSLLGLGVDYKGEVRINTYLSPVVPPPMPGIGRTPISEKKKGEQAPLAQSLEKAVVYLEERQTSGGAFYSMQSPFPTLELVGDIEISPFVTSAILYGLGFAPGPKAALIRHRGRGFLLGEMGPPGCWRYWSSFYRNDLPPDLDDSACAALVLHDQVPDEHFSLDRHIFLKHRNQEGLFQTWMDSYLSGNDVDSVVNANVLAVLGDSDESNVVCQYLNGIVERGEEQQSYWYYLDDIALYYAISRALYLGVSRLLPTKQRIMSRLCGMLEKDILPATSLSTALTLCTLVNLDCERFDLLFILSDRLLQTQNSSGGWDKSAYYGGKKPPGPKTIFFGSEELVTGFCVEALGRTYQSVLKVNSR